MALAWSAGILLVVILLVLRSIIGRFVWVEWLDFAKLIIGIRLDYRFQS
jgi:hypothetical protein